MKFDRKNRTGVVWRKTVKNKLVNTVFLTKSVDIKFCNCCKQYLPKTDFYFKSDAKCKDPERLRCICINCYDADNGKYVYKPKLEPSIDMDQFF